MKEIRISDFFIGGLSTMGATIFSNPLEVIKTRLQLQGELKKKGEYVKSYRGVFHAFVLIAKHEGIYGLQKGLVPAVTFNFIVNAIRMGIFETVSNAGLTKNQMGNESILLCLLWGAFSGCVGSCTGSPFNMLRTQFQSYSGSGIMVGHQREHGGMLSTLKSVYIRRGIRGLYSGVLGNIPRFSIGSGVQLGIFGPTKDLLRRHGLSSSHEIVNTFFCGFTAGSLMALATSPPDLVLTRLFNQPVDGTGKGLLYNGVFDCIIKTHKNEGIFGLLKGFWPNYYRVVFHSTLMFLFFDELKSLRLKYEN